MPKLRSFLSQFRRVISDEGISPIFIILFLAIAIFGSTYLVQNRTSFLPFAKVVDDQEDFNAVSVKCTNEDGNGRFLTIDSNGCGEVTNIPPRCSDEPQGGYTLTFTAPIKQGDKWVTKKSDGSEINEETIKSKMNGDPRMGTNATTRAQNVEKVVQKETINCNLFINYSDDTDCDVDELSFERAGQKMERMLEGETYTIKVKKGANTDRSLPRLARGGVGCRVEMKVAANNSSFSRQESKNRQAQEPDEEEESAIDEFGIFKTFDTQGIVDEDDEESGVNAQTETERKEQELLYAKCGFTKNESGVPVYAVAIGENQNINDPECKELIAKQTTYFENKIEKARREAEEAAKQNGLVYSNGIFQVPDDTPDDKKADAVKKAEELNGTLAKAIKEAETAQEACKDKSGQDQSECLKGIQDIVQKTMDESQKQIAKDTLTKLNAILDGKKPGGCVKADLNVVPHLEAKRLKARGRGENPDPADGGEANDKGRRTFHRLLVCAGKNKQDLKYRVLVGGNAGEEFSNDGEDKGNDAERLYGLYGTEESYEGPPLFGSGFPINRCVTLTGNTADVIRKDLAIYISAAEKGELPKASNGGPCKAESNPNDTGGNGSERRAGASPAPAGSPPSGGTSAECSDNKKCSNDNVCVDGKCLPPKEPFVVPECTNPISCLQQYGDGWNCKERKCVNDGGKYCTGDAYCAEKFPNEPICNTNVCTSRMGRPV